MVISLLAWIYISLICLIWGQMFLSVICASPHPVPTGDLPNRSSLTLKVPLLCLAGLAVISTLTLFLSLFLPLDWKAHCTILLPALAWCGSTRNRKEIGLLLRSMPRRYSPAAFSLLAACILMTLAISSFNSTHPDTINYHAGSILLFERYRPIPGIANLKEQFGFQSAWFASIALFKSNSSYNIIFLNGAVLCWFFLLAVQPLTDCFSPHHFSGSHPPKNFIATSSHGWAWILLLFYTFFSFTQIRLTAASASPDFIVTLYIWAAFFVFLQKPPDGSFVVLQKPAGGTDEQAVNSTLVILFCVAALLIKLSGITILLLAVVVIIGSSRLRSTKWMTLYSFLALIILLVKNCIASGYPLYPLDKPDIFPATWKMKLSTVRSLQGYITRFARSPADSDSPQQYLHGGLTQWVPRWWQQIDSPDRLLILAILAGLLLNLAGIIVRLFKATLPLSRNKSLPPLTQGSHSALANIPHYPLAKVPHTPVRTSERYPIAILTALIGSSIWFLQAPQPRFGTGFLVALCYLLYKGLPLLYKRLPSLYKGLPLLDKVFSSPSSGPKPSLARPNSPPAGSFLSRSAHLLLFLGAWGLLTTITGYTVYRWIHFSTPSQIFRPAGILKEAYEPLGCKSIRVDLLNNKLEINEKNRPVSCQGNEGSFSPIGTTIAEGFKPPD